MVSVSDNQFPTDTYNTYVPRIIDSYGGIYMTKIRSFIWCTLLLWAACTSFSVENTAYAASRQSTDRTPPVLSVTQVQQGYMVTVSTDAPFYLLEWDTRSDFAHKQVHALFRGRQYDALVRSKNQTRLYLQFPDDDQTYFIRAFNVYPDGSGGYSLSRSSGQVTAGAAKDTTDAAKKQGRTKPARLKAPVVRTAYIKKERCIQVTFTLPKKATGYMLECSRKKSFSYKTGHPLYTDDGNYVVRWNENIKKQKQSIKLPLSEFSGKQTYIRVYAISENDSPAEALISPPSTIQKISWK